MNYTEEQLQKIYEMIDIFCVKEYGNDSETMETLFKNPTEVGLAYSTVTDAEIEMQVYLNLIDLQVEWWYDGELFDNETVHFDNAEEMIDWLDENLVFDYLYHTPDLLWNMNETELDDWLENHGKE